MSAKPSVKPFHPMLPLAAVLASSLLLGACSKPTPTEEPIRAVKLLTIGTQSLQSGQEFAGEVRPRIESRLGFRVAGKIVSRTVELGQSVKAGQTLARIDAQDYQLAAQAAQAQVQTARTNLDLAAAEYKRYKGLRDQNFISTAELERRDAALKAAQSQFDQAQAQGAAQGNQAAYTTLVADVSGVVTAVEAETGQVVAAGTPVIRIAQDGVRDAVIAVPENQIASIKVGSTALLKPWGAATTTTSQGTVREVAASADPVTRTFAVKIALPAKETWALGTTVTVQPQFVAAKQESNNLIKLPTSALRENGKGSAVWILDKATMTVKLQPVELGAPDGDSVIVTSGLQAGMQVVAAGVHVLTAGQKVTIYQDKYTKTPVMPVMPVMPVTPVSSASAATKTIAN
ncbi:MAG: hypothetical protein RIR79_1010 [Pseudomonadota bacterium]|jgi:RND family efflux transporter MFP subunit